MDGLEDKGVMGRCRISSENNDGERIHGYVHQQVMSIASTHFQQILVHLQRWETYFWEERKR